MAEKKENKISTSQFFLNLWLIIKKTFFRFLENQGMLIANGLSFKTLIALAPTLVIVAGMMKFFPTFSGFKDNFIDFVKSIVPSDYEFQNIVTWFDSIIEKTGTISSIISIFIFIYLTLDLLITLDNQVERIWGIQLKQPLAQKILKYWALLSATPFVLGGYFYYFGLIRSVILKPFESNTNMEETFYTMITFILLTVFFFFAYFLIPNSKVHPGKAVIVSSIISGVWMVLRVIFTYYTMILIDRLKIFYGSFAVIVIFVLWVSINWIVLLFGVEFLCVWQNKLYIGNLKFKELFLYDIGFFFFILNEFNDDFVANGEGITIKDLSKKYKYNQNDLKKVIRILENEGYVIGSDNQPRKFFLRRNISSITLTELEELVWKRMSMIESGTSPKLQQICEKLGKYYYKRVDKTVIHLNEIINS